MAQSPVQTSGPEPAPHTSPPPARVPGNRWSEIDAPEADELRATLSVAVIVSGAEQEGEEALCRTLAALAAQSYPPELVEVVVCGSGAEPSEALARAAGALTLRSAPDPAQAAAASDSQLLVFLAAGALATERLVAAHARWHHAVSDAVTVGPRPALHGPPPSPDELSAAAERSELAALLAELGAAAEEPYEAFLELTRGLSERRADLFRIAARQNVALRSDTYRAAGGLRAELSEPLARLELAYRLEAHGAVFVPEAEARCFGGNYASDWPLPDEADSEPSEHDRRAEALIPLSGFRAERPGRVFERPALVVDLDVSDERSDEVIESVDAVLRGRLSDLRLRVSVPPEHPERHSIEAALASDPRISAGPEATAAAPDSPYRVSLPLLAVPDERTFSDLHGLIGSEGVGALHVTVPGELPRNAMVEVVEAGAAARARRLAALDGVEEAPLLGELFGERWISGVEVSLRRRGAAEPQVTEHGPLAPATDLAHERAEHLKQRGRARKQESRADRFAQRAVRERLRARTEKARADRLEHQLEVVRGRRSHRILSLARRAARAVRARRGS